MAFIDTHVHIDLYDNPIQIAMDYENAKIYTLFVTNLPELFEKLFHSFKNLKYVRLCLGYHPQLSTEFEFNDLLFKKHISNTHYIGEIGLDFKGLTEKQILYQIEVFKHITSPQFNKGKIFSIHSKDGTEDLILEILKENNVKHAIFHWYSGKLRTIDQIVNAGYYFSLNPKMLSSKKGLQIIKRIPIDFMLFETDGPFTKTNGAIITPSKIPLLFQDFELVVPNFTKSVFNNFRRLLILKDLY